jgi:tRNA A37 threonylcarbamoyladenosine biosynthesis protein TsaE
MNLYKGRLGLCHFDFYRIEKESEMEDLLEEYVYRDGLICVVEWGEPLMHRLESYIHIHFDIEDQVRIITETRMKTDDEIHSKTGGAG